MRELDVDLAMEAVFSKSAQRNRTSEFDRGAAEGIVGGSAIGGGLLMRRERKRQSVKLYDAVGRYNNSQAAYERTLNNLHTKGKQLRANGKFRGKQPYRDAITALSRKTHQRRAAVERFVGRTALKDGYKTGIRAAIGGGALLSADALRRLYNSNR